MLIKKVIRSTVICGFILIFLAIIILLCRKHILTFDRKIDLVGIISFLSLLIAILSLLSSNYTTKRSLHYTQLQLRFSRHQQVIEQAKNVAAWISNYKATVCYPDEWGNSLASVITIHNSSTIPIYKVFIFTVFNKVEYNCKNLKIDPHELAYIEIVPPGIQHVGLYSGGPSMGGGMESVAIIFTDSQSNVWYRNNFGKLTLIDEKVRENILVRNNVRPPYAQYGPITAK